jgi:hypothetical protein
MIQAITSKKLKNKGSQMGHTKKKIIEKNDALKKLSNKKNILPHQKLYNY